MLTNSSTNAVADPAAYGLTTATSPVWSVHSLTPVVACSRPNSATVQEPIPVLGPPTAPTETGHLAIAAEAEEQLSHITIDNLNIAAGAVHRFIHRSSGRY